MYTVFGGVNSRAFRVLWLLEEVGAKYQLQAEAPRSDAVRALNPTGKIPVLKDGSAVMTDSVAIMTYLADKHSALTHAPGSVERAHQDALTFRILDEVDSVLWMAARHSFVLPPEMRHPEIKASLRLEYAQNLTQIAQEFRGPFLAGDMMTIPDILLTHCCNWAVSAKFPSPPDSLKPYLSAQRARPAFQKIRALKG